jgi:uncharacterized membrane protein YeiB
MKTPAVAPNSRIDLIDALRGSALFGILAHYWLKRFYYGPLEWVWRSCTFLTLATPMRKRSETERADATASRGVAV